MKYDSQGRQEANNKKISKNTPKDLRPFPRKDAELLQGLPPKVLLVCKVVGFRHMAIEAGTPSVGVGHYLWRGRVHLPEYMNYARNQAYGQFRG